MRTEPEIKFTRKFISHHEFRSVVKGEEGGGGGGVKGSEHEMHSTLLFVMKELS